jgi:hypothetical protein
MTPQPFRWRRAAAIALGVVLLLWLALVQRWLMATNPALPGVFANLFLPWTFSTEAIPAGGVAMAVVAAALTHGFGLLVVRALGVGAGRLQRHALAFPVGFGLSGIAIELLTMARCLYTVPLWLLWALMIGAAWWAGRHPAVARWCGAPLLDSAPPPDDPTAGAGLRADWRAAGRGQRAFVIAALALTALISLAILWHGFLLPETYWDSLILYLGYARMTFLEHGFPFKAEAQVGIGLGANYPHAYSTYGAMASTLFGTWSDLPQRLAAPLAALVSTVCVYTVVHGVWRHHGLAAAAALMFRAIPNGIAYGTYASDYAFAILYLAAQSLACLVLVRRPTRGALVLTTLMPAMAMHLNYLMGLLWVPWGLALWGIHLLRPVPVLAAARGLVLCRTTWAVFGVGVALASPWHIRNAVLTGNPVYAFFPEIFTRSVRMNTEVLRSAELEWFRNGDGIARLAEMWVDFGRGTRRDESSPDFRREAGLGHRIAASFNFWVGLDVLELREDGTIGTAGWGARLAAMARGPNHDGPRPQIYHHAYKMAPLFPGLVFPALVLLPLVVVAGMAVGGRAWAMRHRAAIVVGGCAWATTLAMLAYIYLLADFYLYQIIGMIGPATIAAVAPLGMLRGVARSRVLAAAFGALVLVVGVVPGLAFGLVNFKFSGNRVVYGQPFEQLRLDALRRPGMAPALMWRLRYGTSPDMWDFVNARLAGRAILTHENRHYVFDPSITLVHLDDWEVQRLYTEPDPAARVAALHAMGVRHYLRTANEANHWINGRLRMDELEAGGWLRELRRTDEETLFEILEAPQPRSE